MQPDRYIPQEAKEYILSMSSVKAPDPKVKEALGGTDGSSWDRGCSLASLYCDEGKDSNELSGGVGGPLENDGGDGHCVESDGKRLSNSVRVVVGQSKFSKVNGESYEYGKAAKEVDRSGPAGIGNCNKEPKSCSKPKSLEDLDVNVASCPRSGGTRS